MSAIRPCRLVPFAVGGVLAVVLAGCTPRDEPRRQQEPQEKAASPAPGRAASAPAGPSAPGGPALAYDAPQGWVAGSGGRMRRAAFVVQDGDRKVEVTAIDLAAQAGALLPNVNRWRTQIQLPEITQSELDKSISRVPVGDVQGAYVELLGPEGAGPRQAILGVVAMRGEQAWFFKLWGDAKLALREKARFLEFVKSVRFLPPGSGGLPAAPPPKSDSPLAVVTEADEGSPPLEYATPQGWTPSESEGAGRAAFQVADGDRKVEITVMHLPGRVKNMLLNVNRWRRQVQLAQITQAELDKTLQLLPVAGQDGQYVEVVGPPGAKPRLAMLIVLVNHEKKSWMFRLMGDADLALREKERFQGFVKSFKLPAEGKGKNGA